MRMRRFLAAALAVAMLAGNTMTAFATDVTPVPTNTGAASENNEGTDIPGTPSGEVVVEPTPETTPVVTDAPTPEVTPDAPTPEVTPTTPATGEVTPTAPAEGEVTPSVPATGEVSPEVTPSDMVSPSVSPELSTTAMKLTNTYAQGDSTRDAGENVLLTNYSGDERAYYTNVEDAVKAANEQYSEGEKYVISLLPQMVAENDAENVPLEFEVSVSVLNSITKKSQLHMGGQILKIVCSDTMPVIQFDIDDICTKNNGSQNLKQGEIRVSGNKPLKFVKPEYINGSDSSELQQRINNIKITFVNSDAANIIIGDRFNIDKDDGKCSVCFDNVTLPDNTDLSINDSFYDLCSSITQTVSSININADYTYKSDNINIDKLESVALQYNKLTAKSITVNGNTSLQSDVDVDNLIVNYDLYSNKTLTVNDTLTISECRITIHGDTVINNCVSRKRVNGSDYGRSCIEMFEGKDGSVPTLTINNASRESATDSQDAYIYLSYYSYNGSSWVSDNIPTGTTVATIGDDCDEKVFASGNTYILKRDGNKLILTKPYFSVFYSSGESYLNKAFVSLDEVKKFIYSDDSGSDYYSVCLRDDIELVDDINFDMTETSRPNVSVSLSLDGHVLSLKKENTEIVIGGISNGTIKVAKNATVSFLDNGTTKYGYYTPIQANDLIIEFDDASETGGMVVGHEDHSGGLTISDVFSEEGEEWIHQFNSFIRNSENLTLTLNATFDFGNTYVYNYLWGGLVSDKDFQSHSLSFNKIICNEMNSQYKPDYNNAAQFSVPVRANELVLSGSLSAYSLDVQNLVAKESSVLEIAAPSKIANVTCVKSSEQTTEDAPIIRIRSVKRKDNDNVVSEGMIEFSGTYKSDYSGAGLKLESTMATIVEGNGMYYLGTVLEDTYAGEVLAKISNTADESFISDRNFYISDVAGKNVFDVGMDVDEDGNYLISAVAVSDDVVVSFLKPVDNTENWYEYEVVSTRGFSTLKAARKYILSQSDSLSTENRVDITLNKNAYAGANDLDYSEMNCSVVVDVNLYDIIFDDDADAVISVDDIGGNDKSNWAEGKNRIFLPAGHTLSLLNQQEPSSTYFIHELEFVSDAEKPSSLKLGRDPKTHQYEWGEKYYEKYKVELEDVIFTNAFQSIESNAYVFNFVHRHVSLHVLSSMTDFGLIDNRDFDLTVDGTYTVKNGILRIGSHSSLTVENLEFVDEVNSSEKEYRIILNECNVNTKGHTCDKLLPKLTIKKRLITPDDDKPVSMLRSTHSGQFKDGDVILYGINENAYAEWGDKIIVSGSTVYLEQVNDTVVARNGGVVEVHNEEKSKLYQSLEEAAGKMATDFASSKGEYTIILFDDVTLKSDITIPSFVTDLTISSDEDENGVSYLRYLDLNGKKFTTSARVNLDSGLRFKSEGSTKGQLVINAVDGTDYRPTLYINEAGALVEIFEYTYGCQTIERVHVDPVLDNTVLSVPNGSVVLESDNYIQVEDRIFNSLRATINAKNLTINGGNWEIPDNVTITNGYLYVSDGSRLISNQTITLNNSTTEFGQEAYVGAKNMTLAGSCLNVKDAEVEVEEKISVTKVNPAEIYGEDTIMIKGERGRIEASELEMSVGTISVSDSAKVLIKKITKANNIRLSRNAGLVCDAITQLDAAKTYMSDGGCLWVGSEGTINNIVLENDNAFLGRAEGAALTVNKSVTGTSEDNKLRVFVTDKAHKYSDTEALLNNLDKIKDCTAEDVVVPDPDSVLFNTGIAAFPVDRVEVWAWTTPEGQDPEFTENDAVYQSGNKMLVTGKFIEIFTAKANGDGEEYLKGFTTWKEASNYLNTLNNTSATYIVRFGKDIDINQALTLPKNVKKIVLTSSDDNEPKKLSYMGALSLSTDTEFVNINLNPYIVTKTGKNSDYKATINTNGKDLLFSSSCFVNDSGNDKSINTIKGNAATDITLDASKLELNSLSGINSITLIDSDITSSGVLSVNTLYVTGMDESVVKVSGNANLEVKKDLIMEAKTTLDSAGKITLTNIQTENQGNLFKTATNGAITIKGIVSSYDRSQIGLQADIVSSGSGETFNGFKLAAENATNVDAWVMNNAIALSYGDMGTPAPQAKLMANAVKAPATFFVASETGFVTGGKPVGTTVAGAVLRKDSGNLYTDYATDNLVELLDISNDDLILGQFKTVSQAFKAIDELANPEGRYRLLVKCQDKNLDTKGNVVDYKFPTKLEWLEIDGSGHEEAALMFKKDIKIGSDVVFIDIDISPDISGGTINLGNYRACFEDVSFPNDANMNISGGGVTKGSELVFKNESSGRKDYSVGNITNVGKVAIDSNTTLQVNGTANVGNIHAEGSKSEPYDKLPILKVGVKLTRAADRTVTKSTPNLTINGTVVRNNKLVVELFDSADSSATVINNKLGDSEYAKLAGTGGGGLIFAKAAKVETDAISLSATEPPYVYKKSGNLVAKITEPQVSLSGSYDEGTDYCIIESVFDSYADAIAEINSLKNKGDYSLKFISSDMTAPIELTMPKAGTAHSLTLTTSNGQDVPVYYTGNLALTTNVVLDNLDFVQVAKYDGTYSRVDEHNASVKTYSVPVNVSVGGAYTLDIEGKVTFNTPINLTGSNKATLDLNNGILVATARTDGKSASGYNADDQGMTYTNIEGSVAKFAKINVKSDTNITGYFKGSVPDSLGGSEPMPTYVGVAFSTNDLVVNNAAEFVVGRLGQTVDSLTVGNNCVNAGNITSYGNSTFKNLSLTNSGDIDVKGQTFKISGNVTSLSPGSVLYTTVSKKDGKSVLTIDGTVTLTDPEYRIGVAVSDTAGNYFEFGKAIPNESGKYYSNRLLNAKNGSIDSFVVSENLNSELYDENNNTTGYFLKKRGNEILVYYGEDVAVKLDINGDINYYTSFNEAVAAIDAGSEAVEQCTITLLKPDVDDCYYENIKLPKKARNLTIMTEGDEPTYIVSSNKLTLSGNVKLKNIAIMAPEKKTFDIDTKNYQLELEDSGICAGNITGNNKNGSNKLVLVASRVYDTVLVVNSIKGVNTLDLKNGYVQCNGTVNVGSLVGCGQLFYGQLTVNNELKRDGIKDLILQKTVAITPAAITGVKASITENNKLATIGNANYVADGVAFYDDNVKKANTIWANGCLYAVDDSIYSKSVDVEYGDKTVKCLDMAQATNLIEKINVAANDYVLKVGADISDPNITDTSAVSALKLPDKKKAKSVNIASAKVNGDPATVEPVSISATTCTATTLILENVNLTTTGKSSATDLELNNGSWVAYGATTIGSITDVTGGDSFLGTQLIKNVPQLTVTGDVNKNIRMKLFEQATKKEITDALTEESEKKANMPLVIAKKASASRFIASPYAITGTGEEAFDMASGVSAYKNKSNYVYNGDISGMEVILYAEGLETYVKTYAEAIQIINNISDKNSDYVIKLRKTDNNNGEIRTAVDKNGKAVYGALALPAAGKAASLTIESESDKLELLFTGAVSPKCDLTFKNVEITEGKVSKGNFIPNNYITPNYSGVTLTLGDGVTTPGAAESLANDNYLINIGNENAVLPTPSVVINTVKAQDTRSAKGTLALSVSVYVKGKTEIADIRAENDVSLYTKSQTVLGSISGNNKLYLVTAYTDKAGKDWKTSASQLTINGELDSSAQLALVPYYYVLEGSKFLKPFYLDMLHDMAYYGENKPAAYKKLLTAPKLQVGGNNIKLVSGVDHKDVTGYSFVKFGGGVYITDMARAINVKGYSSDDSENPLYIGEFFTWDQAVAEIEKLGHANDKTGSGGWNYEIVLNDSLGIDKPLSSVPMPSKANKVTIKASDPKFGIITTASSVAIKANTDLEIPIVSVKKSGNNYYDVAYTLNTGGFALNINNVPTMANLGGTDRRPLIKLTGNAKGSVDVNMNDNGDEIINQITNIGMVKLNTNNNSKCVFLVANGISGVGELVINPNVTVDTVEKDINVKKLTAVGVNGGTPKIAIAIAKNITVTDTLTIGSAYLRAGTAKSGDGKVTLTNVILKDNANVIEGKQDAKGGSQIQIKGTVASAGADAGSPAVEIGLYYNNSIKEYVRLSEDMTILTAPKVETSWFVPAYSTEDSIRMGAEIEEQLATMSCGEFEKDAEGNVIHNPVRTYGLYKSGNNIKYGRLIDVEQVSINGNAPELVQVGEAEALLYIGTDHSNANTPYIAFRTFEEAVKAIDSMALKAADGKTMEQYTIKLNSNVYIGGDNATSKLKALTLPSRTSKLTVEGDSDAGFTKINFNGNITLKSNVTFVSCDLNSIKDAGGEVFSIPVNYAIGNWTLEMLNSSFDASNITGSAKSGTLILKEDDPRYFYPYKVASIKGLNSLILDNASITSAGDVNVNRVVSVNGENKQGYLGCNGNVVLNSIESNGNNFTMSISSDKTVKINGTQVTDENGNKKYVSNTGSGLPVLKVTEGNKKLAPGTLLISGKYLSDLAGMQIIISGSEQYNCYVRTDGLYLGNKQQ